jgi:hypothetical protein
MAARKRKLKLTESWKDKIRVSMLLNRLDNHIFKNDEMTSTQLDAAKFLLNKVMANPPTDTTVEHSGSIAFGWIVE